MSEQVVSEIQDSIASQAQDFVERINEDVAGILRARLQEEAQSEPESEQPPDQYRVAILWGEEAVDVSKYSFNTQGELDAFIAGITAAQGWNDWDAASNAICSDGSVDEDVLRRIRQQYTNMSEEQATKMLKEVVEWENEGRQTKDE